MSSLKVINVMACLACASLGRRVQTWNALDNKLGGANLQEEGKRAADKVVSVMTDQDLQQEFPQFAQNITQEDSKSYALMETNRLETLASAKLVFNPAAAFERSGIASKHKLTQFLSAGPGRIRPLNNDVGHGAVNNVVAHASGRHPGSTMMLGGAGSQVAKQLEAQGRKDVKVVSNSKIIADGKEAFWKVGTGGSSANVDLLQYEAQGLARMADASDGMLAVPRPWLVGEVSTLGGGSSGFIVMDMLEPARRGPGAQRQLGLGLAKMHSAPPAADWEPGLFGFPLDGCCGAFSQPNNAQRKKMNWIEFWAEFRLKHQLRGIRDKEAQEMGDKIIKNLPKLFPFPIEEIQPSLLHGDLWGGNHGVDGKTGLPSIYDPACYYGHDEADFGIAHMFGGLSDEFYKAYFSVRPKREGFEQRALLYELHHHLNHYNIFGGSYLSGAKSLMYRLLKEMASL